MSHTAVTPQPEEQILASTNCAERILGLVSSRLEPVLT